MYHSYTYMYMDVRMSDHVRRILSCMKPYRAKGCRIQVDENQPVVSIVVPFLGSPYRILYKYLAKPKKELQWRL